jgi:secretion/DNA translocation related CpaE-like protein
MGHLRPLVLTADTELLDDVLGAAAAVGVAVDVAPDPGLCRPQWTAAPLVLVGSDLGAAVASSTLRSRPGVLLVNRGEPTQEDRISAAQVGAEDLVMLPADETALLERLADVVEPPKGGRIIGVLPGRGGAGASVLAAAIALTAADRGDAAWLVDLDPLGGGADAVLGAELAGGARWHELGSISGRLSSRALRDALPEVGGVAVLSCSGEPDVDPEPAAILAVLAATRRGGDTVVVDLPRRLGPRLDFAQELLLVVPAELRAVLAARQFLRRVDSLCPPLGLVVRKVPNGLPVGDVVRATGIDLIGDYVDEPEAQAALLTGDPRGLVSGTKLGLLCQRILDRPAMTARAA